jgi:transposase|uniref:Transposase IS4-like domain-containing protein n=1 Tax=Desulfobacca acetoxidans TaxID=60893 RepID=A0A7V6A3H7_9BACT
MFAGGKTKGPYRYIQIVEKHREGKRTLQRVLKVEKEAVSIDQVAVWAEARFDGKYVLRTNTGLPAAEVAMQYKRLLVVEQFFPAAKPLINTRPLFHHGDASIRGHVFCSFLALVLPGGLQRRLA